MTRIFEKPTTDENFSRAKFTVHNVLLKRHKALWENIFINRRYAVSKKKKPMLTF